MTAVKLQHLLVFLGFDTGGTEGIYGPKTRQAVMDFQREFGGLEVDGDAGAETEKALRKAVGQNWTRPQKKEEVVPNSGTSIPAWWKDIRYFTREEFRCPCGRCGGFPVEPAEALVRFLDTMRGAFGKAVIVVPPDGHSGGSGVRCKAYNDSLPGSAKTSYHLLGKAADFSAPGVPESTIEGYLAKAKTAGKIRYWYRISAGNYHVEVN